MKTEFSPGDLIEKRIDNKYYYSTLRINHEYGIVLETKTKDYGAYREQDAMTREWVRVLWVGNKPVSSWHVIYSRNPRLIKLGGIGFND